MNCPKYIKDALKSRAKYASLFCKYDLLISKWCDENGIEAFGDIHLAAESIMAPYESADRIFQAIQEKE